MAKATQETTPPPLCRDTCQVAPEEAAAAVGRCAPSIEELGTHLAAVEVAYHAFDAASARAHGRNPSLRDAERILGDRDHALRLLISTLPAHTLQDAAIQVAEIATVAAVLGASDAPADQAIVAADRIERMALGILPIVASAAGLDMASMNWLDQDALRVTRFAGVGVKP